MPEIPDTENLADLVPRKPAAGRGALGAWPFSYGLLIFGFGSVAGFILAFSGLGLLEDAVGVFLVVCLAILMFIAAFGLILYLFHKPLLRRLFGFAQTQMELFSAPLGEVARGAIDRDPRRATDAAQDLVAMALARYSWITTRRWIIGSLTALIAAMAALAGTTLLFSQNKLLEEQRDLFEIQNAHVEAQNALLDRQNQFVSAQNELVSGQNDMLVQQLELAEAARNAEIAVEITRIAGLLGEVLDRSGQTPAEGDAGLVPVLDPYRDVSPSLRMRIIAASRAAKPYRFIEPPLNAHDATDKLRVASLRRRGDLPRFYAGVQAAFRFSEPEPGIHLTDVPLSPERGQLLWILQNSGLRALETFTHFGLDLSHAHAEDFRLLGVTAQGVQMSYARLERAQILHSDLGGGALENASFAGSRIESTRLDALTPGRGLGPYADYADTLATFLSGASFKGAYLADVGLTGIQGIAMDFDGATLNGVRFDGSLLGGSTFRDAVLLDVGFDGAGLQSVEFDGAFVARADFLDWVNGQAAAGTFRPDRFAIAPAPAEAVLEVDSAYTSLDPAEIPPLWRIERIAGFETD